MDLYPQDLGDKIGRLVQRQRVPLIETEASLSLRALATLCLGSLLGMFLTGLYQEPVSALFFVATIVTGGLWVSGALKARREQELGEDRVTDYEIAQLRDGVQDPLARTYLKLVRTILSVPALPGASAEQEIRSAVAALGTAIDSLPQPEIMAVSPSVTERPPLLDRLHQDHKPEAVAVTDDPDALQSEAGRLADKAQSEADPVIRASFQRRAESLARRAETAARTLTLLRRNQALREEIAEQIDALRTNLTAFSVGGKQSAQDFAGLAASIQRVTLEANAITVARAEIDTLLAEPTRLSVTNETQGPVRVNSR